MPKTTQKTKVSEKRILIAEDDKAYANIYRVKLINEGFNVTICLTGADAIKKIGEIAPHLIILDLIMPEKDGFDVLEELQKRPQLKKIPIIVFSNLSQDEDIVRAKNMGVSDYFVKANLSIHEMVEKVREYLR